MTEEIQQTAGEAGSTAVESIATTPKIIVIKHKKKKKKYSNGLRTPQELLVASSKAYAKLTSAAHIAVEEWVKRNEKSAVKRKDGIFKDGLTNMGHATHKGLRKALKAPEKFMDELEKTKMYKQRFKPFRFI